VATRYVLSTDASNRGERASIGVVLRQKTTARGSEVVAYISHEINPVSIAAAEYRALYEGLRLVASYKPKELQVFTDADYIPKLVTQEKRPKNSEIADAWSQAVAQIAKLKDAWTAFSISWVPREMNWEADQRAADGFFRKRGRLAARRDEWSA
jgi:ribonuclease HI